MRGSPGSERGATDSTDSTGLTRLHVIIVREVTLHTELAAAVLLFHTYLYGIALQ
jgi:hypothetical protein